MLLAHAAAVGKFRRRFGGTTAPRRRISIVNCGWMAWPLRAESPGDVAAADSFLEAQWAWFLDPVVFGDYPTSLKTRAGADLPRFTAAEQKALAGSFDELGVNYYTARYVARPDAEHPATAAAEGIPKLNNLYHVAMRASRAEIVWFCDVLPTLLVGPGFRSSPRGRRPRPLAIPSAASSPSEYPRVAPRRGRDPFPTKPLHASPRGGAAILPRNIHASPRGGGATRPRKRSDATKNIEIRYRGLAGEELIGAKAGSPWLFSAPPGLRDVLLWLDARYDRPVLMVTENGCDQPAALDLTEALAVDDAFRVNYIRQHIESVGAPASRELVAPRTIRGTPRGVAATPV